ncbi:hypothetical protein [Crucivirus-482]|nr:hypothetical protein [Crucivirus-482]
MHRATFPGEAESRARLRDSYRSHPQLWIHGLVHQPPTRQYHDTFRITRARRFLTYTHPRAEYNRIEALYIQARRGNTAKRVQMSRALSTIDRSIAEARIPLPPIWKRYEGKRRTLRRQLYAITPDSHGRLPDVYGNDYLNYKYARRL